MSLLPLARHGPESRLVHNALALRLVRGRLSCGQHEMRRFSEENGFQGDDAQWLGEYRLALHAVHC
eukprot:4211907-Amphidinium_carterae.1